MYQKLIFIFSLILFSQFAFAETCPSVNDLKKQALAEGWKAYDSEENTPLSPAQIAEVVKNADQFALAEWADDARAGGAIHCYYRDQHGSNLEAYFAKDNFKPDNGKNVWYQVSGFMHCAAGSDKCAFQSSPIAPEKQLAKK